MTIEDLFQILRKHIITVIITFVIIVSCGVAYLVAAPRKYTATAQLFATANTEAMGAGTEVNNMYNTANYLNTQIKTYPTLVKTEAVLNPVIKELNLNISAGQLGGTVTASNPANTFIVDISAVSQDPVTASRVANSTAQSLSRNVSNTTTSSTTNKSLITLTLVQSASVPSKPSSPNTFLVGAASVVAGLIAAFLAALAKDTFNTRIDKSSTVREITKSNTIGFISRDAIFAEDKRPVIINRPDSGIAEDFRRIKTNISFLTPSDSDSHHLHVFTSADPSEGKTTTIVNTAVALAEDGARVLLIDADLRHPSVANMLGIEGSVGLSHILAGKAVPKDVVQPYWKSNLHVLPAGKRPANPSVLINSETMSRLLSQAARQYDYVLVDTAPMVVSNDAVVLGHIAHGVVIIAAKGIADRQDLRDMVSALDAAEIPIHGFVYTFADLKKNSNKKNYYYYGSGSGSNGNSRQKGSHRA